MKYNNCLCYSGAASYFEVTRAVTWLTPPVI